MAALAEELASRYELGIAEMEVRAQAVVVELVEGLLNARDQGLRVVTARRDIAKGLEPRGPRYQVPGDDLAAQVDRHCDQVLLVLLDESSQRGQHEVLHALADDATDSWCGGLGRFVLAHAGIVAAGSDTWQPKTLIRPASARGRFTRRSCSAPRSSRG